MTSTRTEVPSGWAKSRFTELAVRRSGVKISKASKSIYQTNGKFPVIDQGQEMVAGFVDDDELQFPGQLPVIVFGDHTRIFKYVDFPFVPGADGTQIITPRLDRVDASFLYYALCNLPLTNLGYSRHFKLLKQHLIRFPKNLCEQRKIAAILSSVDDAIEKTQAVIDQVQVVKRSLMQELLSRGLPGRHTRFKQTEIGEIPEEWEVRALVDCCNGKGQYGANVAKADFKPGGIRYIRITDIDDNGALRDNAVGISGENADGYLLQLGDILFARSGATVGKAYMHRDPGMRSAFAGYLVRFRTKRDVLLPTFLREYLNTDVYWRWVGDRQRAQAQPNINATEYGQLPVPCAPLDEQRRVMEIVESFNSSLLRARAEVLGKQWLKRALMPVLLTGELRVTPGPEVA